MIWMKFFFVLGEKKVKNFIVEYFIIQAKNNLYGWFSGICPVCIHIHQGYENLNAPELAISLLEKDSIWIVLP